MNWLVFILFFAIIFTYDLCANFKRHITFKIALRRALFVITCAVIFFIFVWHGHGLETALQFAGGYLIELSLGIDNLFVFSLIFADFHIPHDLQPKILAYGILGALVMRFVLIWAGLQGIAHIHFLLNVFGAFLLVVSVGMFRKREKALTPQKKMLYIFAKRLLPFIDKLEDGKFFIRKGGSFYATPLFAALLVIESSDLVFAIDSITAIFGITTDPFIVYTSNAFALLGLRSMYTLLQNLLDYFIYMHIALALVLAFIGTKLLLSGFFYVPVGVSLAVIVSIFATAILFSIQYRRKKK